MSYSSAAAVRHALLAGQVQAVTLAYSDAHASLVAAARRAPPSAAAFSATVTAWRVVVELLMGDVPERRAFAPPALRPYLELTRAVRAGSVTAYSAALAAHGAAYDAAGTLALVRRLGANVIKTGLRRIATAYSAIALSDVAARLALPSPADAESLAAKAIRDGVLDAVLDHDAGRLVARPAPNVYSTREPADAFHRRITFCLDVHAEATKALRFPQKAARADLESAEAKRAREEEEEALVELGGMDDGDDDDGFDD